MKPQFNRVLIKLSGELLSSQGQGVDVDAVSSILAEIKKIVDSGVEVAIVIGGGNILRGAHATFGKHVQRATADAMGMLATMINALALVDMFEAIGVEAFALSAKEVPGVLEAANFKHAQSLLKQKKVVIFAGGTGNPFVTTDTTASLRAAEIQADAILKVTTVDGVYDKDPNQNHDAKRFESLTFDQALENKLAVMDLAAFVQCRELNIPICVFSMNEPQSLMGVVCGEQVGTWVQN